VDEVGEDLGRVVRELGDDEFGMTEGLYQTDRVRPRRTTTLDTHHREAVLPDAPSGVVAPLLDGAAIAHETHVLPASSLNLS
jgi:hypothetical protein